MKQKPTYKELEEKVKKLTTENQFYREIYRKEAAFTQMQSVDYKFTDLININELNELLEGFGSITKCSNAILDPQGNIISATAWQKICTNFHRKNQHTARFCEQSDSYIKHHLEKGKYTLYKCKNGLYDIAIPIIVANRHLATFFLGQFFFADEKVDTEFFKKQAEKYNFDEKEYFAALDEVPIIEREYFNDLMKMFVNFTDFLAQMATLHLKNTIARKQLNGINQKLKNTVKERTEQLATANEELRTSNEELLAINDRLSKEIDDKTSIENELKQSEERFRIIFENATLGIVLATANADIHSANPAFCDMLGYTENELKNMNFSRFTHPDDIKKELRYIERLLAGETRTYTIQKRYITKSKNTIWVNVSVAPYRNDKGELTYFIGIIEDITQRKKAEKTLKESEKQLRELNNAKDKFFSIIAHDLKNPFNALLGLSEHLVFNEDIDEEEKKSIHQLIYDSARRGYNLLENLLEWSRAQTGRLKPDPKTININEIIQEKIFFTENAAQIKNITVENTTQEKIYACADRIMVETIIRNLLTNAIKFTGKGGKITINAKKISDTFIEIAVADSGIGIKKENLDKLFRIDVNFTTSGTKNEVGTGLGLIICKEFVEKNNGTIKVNSKYGQGSTFLFTLPIAKKQQEA